MCRFSHWWFETFLESFKSRGNLIFHSNFAFWSLPPGSAKVSLGTRNFDFQVDQKGRLGKGLSYFYKVRFYVLTQFSWHNRFNKTHEYTRYLKDVSWKSLNLYSNELQQMGKLNVGKIWKLSLTWRVNCIIYGWNWLTPFLVPEKNNISDNDIQGYKETWFYLS